MISLLPRPQPPVLDLGAIDDEWALAPVPARALPAEQLIVIAAWVSVAVWGGFLLILSCSS